MGTFAHLPPAVEVFACKRLGLTPAPASSQIVKLMTPAELEDCFSSGYPTRHMDDIFQRVFGRSR